MNNKIINFVKPATNLRDVLNVNETNKNNVECLEFFIN